MEARLFIRAMCVGAALLVPAGGLTMVGVGTAGANTKVQLTMSAKLGGVGTLKAKTFLCTIAAGTHQCPATTIQFTILKGATQPGKALFTTSKILITLGPPVRKISVKKNADIQIKSTTVPGINGCLITIGIKITFTQTAAPNTKKWHANTISTTTVKVTTTSACATHTTIQSEISGTKITADLTTVVA
jgi:hypothetical protein